MKDPVCLGSLNEYIFYLRSPPKTILESFSMSPPVKHELELILKEIRIITDKIKEDDNTTNISGDWKFAAMVLDRSGKNINFLHH